MLKRRTALVLIIAILVSFCTCLGEEQSSTYSALAFVDDPFIKHLLEYDGMTEAQVENFMDDVDDYIDSFQENIYESDEDAMFIAIILQVMQREEHLPVMVAFDAMFPDEIVYMLETRKVPEVMHNFRDISMRRRVIVEIPPEVTEEPEPTPTPSQEPEEEKSRYFDDLSGYEYALEAVDA